MFKKKITYIIGIVVFTLIFIADLVLFFVVPTNGGRGNMQSFDKGSFNAESFDGEMPENGEMPEGFTMPEDGEMPENGEMPEGFTMPENGEMPEGFDKSDMPGRGQGGQSSGGAANIIRIAFWPVLIISILGDGLCIFMLVRLSKKKEDDDGADGLSDEPAPEEETGDNPPRRDKTNTYLGIVAGILVVAVVISSLTSGVTTGTREAEESILQQDVTVADIVSTFSGSGTLESSDAEEMELPASVTVSSYTVKNGDYVEKGDVIAKVSKESVLNAIYEIQNLIDEMDEEIAEVKSNTLDSEITARADGRVKAVYAEAGESVSEAMYNNGALILISLGGSMSVEIESDEEVTVGQALTVKLSDKSTVEGKVQQVRNGVITVTTTDNGPTHGDTVTVYTEDGTKLGKGTLEVSSALKVTGYAGTVTTVHVEIDEKVSTGDTLLTLKDTEDKARYQQLLRERNELTALQSSLAEMYQDGTVKAQQSGIISGLSDDISYMPLTTATTTASTELSLSSSESASTMQLSRTSGNSPKVMSLSSSTASDTPTITFLSGEPTSEETTTEATTAQATDESTTAQDETTTGTREPGTTLPEQASPDKDTTTSADETTQPSGGDMTFPSGGTDFPSNSRADGVYAGKIMAVMSDALYIAMSETDMTDSDISVLETIDETLFTVQEIFTPDVDVSVYVYEKGKSVLSSLSAVQAGDKVFLTIEKGVLTRIDYIVGTGESQPSQGTFPDNTISSDITDGTVPSISDSISQIQGEMPSANADSNSYVIGSVDASSAVSGFSYQQTDSNEDEEATYTVDKISLCAITPSDTMTIDISVDELDILSLKVGQEVTVTLDALPGQSTVGSIEKLSPIGTTEDGGSTKYTAVVSVARTEEMLDGMNASIKIEVECLEDVLTIPAAAVYEDGNRTYVYISANTKDGELKESIDITTGACDGTNIEVLSGLAEGDTIYYSYADSIVYRIGN